MVVLEGFFSPETCDKVIQTAEEYADDSGGWTSSRHKNYPTVDISTSVSLSTNYGALNFLHPLMGLCILL